MAKARSSNVYEYYVCGKVSPTTVFYIYKVNTKTKNCSQYRVSTTPNKTYRTGTTIEDILLAFPNSAKKITKKHANALLKECYDSQ